LRKLLAFLLLTAAALPAASINNITINTSTISGTAGYLDFLFNGGAPPFDAASAVISGFSTNGTLNSSGLSTSGTVTGTLPGTSSLANNNAEYLERFTFGSTVSFTLQFQGPAITSPSGTGSGSTFTLSLLNNNQDVAFLTSNQNDGYLFTFTIDNQGNVTPTTFTTETGAPSVVSISSPVSGVPEPSAWLLMSSGSFALLFLRRRGRP
jgi:hypothetical protein